MYVISALGEIPANCERTLERVRKCIERGLGIGYNHGVGETNEQCIGEPCPLHQTEPNAVNTFLSTRL